ncbi:flagellar filament capping protein FliD [[Erwinia] mediterraneensis]|uniref:flagellar filament capping protein FliD n=1 Tax=[Erwinia] mediterraneensis TaxID=2161819 RepID=UPI00103245E7|nr:flagellar filament capping protein FliD [[Erwinia] mediterraneensis]
MTTMTSLGVGSGLDLETMLTQLQAAEQTRLTPYTALQNSYQAKISSWGKISSALSSLQSSVKKLQQDAFNTLSVSTNTAFSATATSDASADSHEITVMQLATAHKIKTTTFDNADQDLGTSAGGERTITITQGDGKKIEVRLKDDETSLNDIAKAINKQGGDLSASVQRTDNGYQLVFSAKTTGSDGEMTVTVDGDDNLAGILNYHSDGQDAGQLTRPTPNAMTEVTAAQDAKLEVDGSTYTRSSNDISDIISGVTLNLKAVSAQEEGHYKSEQLTLTKDTSAIKTSLQEFVKQYNALLKQTSAASKYVPSDTKGLASDSLAKPNAQNGALVGDSMLRGMVGDIRSAVNGVYGDSGADYGSLADLGIKIDAATGQMTLDESKLDEAIADNPGQIANIFQDHNGQQGMATQLNTLITTFIGDTANHIDGQIKSTTDSLNDQVKIVASQIAKTQQLVDAQVERYRIQFQNLDASMSKITGMSNALTSLLSSM